MIPVFVVVCVNLLSSLFQKSESSVAAVDTEGSVVELELDELNRHECMSSLVALLKHMQSNKITPVVAEVFCQQHFIIFACQYLISYTLQC